MLFVSPDDGFDSEVKHFGPSLCRWLHLKHLGNHLHESWLVTWDPLVQTSSRLEYYKPFSEIFCFSWNLRYSAQEKIGNINMIKIMYTFCLHPSPLLFLDELQLQALKLQARLNWLWWYNKYSYSCYTLPKVEFNLHRLLNVRFLLVLGGFLQFTGWDGSITTSVGFKWFS